MAGAALPSAQPRPCPPPAPLSCTAWDLRGGRGERSLRGVVHHQGLEKCQAKNQQPASSHLPDRRSIPLPQVGEMAIIINSIIVCGVVVAGGGLLFFKASSAPPHPPPSQEAQPRDVWRSGITAEGGKEEENRWRSVGGEGKKRNKERGRDTLLSATPAAAPASSDPPPSALLL